MIVQITVQIIIIIIKQRLTRHMSVTKEDESQARETNRRQDRAVRLVCVCVCLCVRIITSGVHGAGSSN